MYHPWNEKLSDYLEGTLPPGEAAALGDHLQDCDECRLTLAQLAEVRDIARAQAPALPAVDLWPGIAERIAARAPDHVLRLEPRRLAPRRLSFSLPQLAAAAVILMALSGGGVWLALGGGVGPAPAAVASPGRDSNPVRLASVETSGYESAIAELQRSLAQTATPLDSSTVAVLRQSLAAIDAAIADARAALAQDPANPFLHRHLDGAMKKKVDILQRAVSARRAAS
jgi:hypothetical protein